MMNWLRKYQYHIFLLTMCVFFFGMFVGFGGYFFTGKSGAGDSIAEVNGESIPLRIFYSHYRRALEQIQQPGKPLEDSARQQKRDESLRDLVQMSLFAKEAERYGIRVPDKQVVMSLTQQQAFQDKGRFSPQLYMQYLQSELHLSPQDFEEEQRKSLAFFKLRWMIQSVIKVTDREFQMEAPVKRASLPPPGPKEKASTDTEIRQQMWQEKVMYSFNQWFSQLGRTLKVKTHFELLEGQR